MKTHHGSARATRVPSAVYAMTTKDENLACELVRRAGEQLDDRHWILAGGARSLAGQLGRLLEHRIFDREEGPQSPEDFVLWYGAYEDRSVHAVVVDEQGPVAAARVIWSPDPAAPTKLEDDLVGIAEIGLIRSELSKKYGTQAFSELATVVVEPRARYTKVTGWILGEMRYQQLCRDPAAPSCAIVSVPFYRMIRAWGHEASKLGGIEAFDYYDLIRQPVFFGPGPQNQVRGSRLFRDLSAGWFERVDRPYGAMALAELGDEPVVDLTGRSTTTTI